MMTKFILVAVVFAGVFASCASQQVGGLSGSTETQSLPAGSKQAVLVELFTSEGCSSCPPADRALALLEKQQPIYGADTITLEFHVDYWDGPGWKDPFSSASFSERQEAYSTALKVGNNYTPQMIVDGSNEFVGSDLGKANQIIQLASAMKKADLKGSIQGEAIKIAVSGLAVHESATIYVATVEDQLTSNVTGGENQGSKLGHTSVVRQLRAVGTISKDAQKYEVESSLNTQPDWKKENLRYIAFVQENDSKKILAAARVVN